jgi:hypothetical protein
MGLAVTATALAAAGCHLVFARAASVAACLLVAAASFLGALLCASGPGALLPDLGAMVLAQAAACCWYALAASDPGPTEGTIHSGTGGTVHVAMTLVTVCALRAVGGSSFRLSIVVQASLRTSVQRLCALLCAWTATAPPEDASRLSEAREGGDKECSSEVLLTGAPGRRGPP